MRRGNALLLTAVIVAAAVLLAPLAVHAEFGSNWTATYYNSPDLSGTPVTSQTGINGINFVWGAGSPVPGVNSDNFTIRYESVQTFQAGTYEFVAASDDGIRVYIDGVLVLDRFIGRVYTTDRFQQVMTAGVHSLRVEYLELIDQAQVQFQYFLISAGGAQPTTSFGVLGTPVPLVTGTPTGPGVTLIGVQGLAVRTGPFLGASFVTTATAGNQYQVIARNRDEGIFTWYLINVNGRQGWASGRYLTVNGIDPNSLPLQGSVFDQIDSAPDLGVIGSPRSVMNLRVRPSERTEILDQLAWGEQVSIIGRTLQAGRNRWFQVRTGEGLVGWIFAPFVAVSGDINAVPVR
jgi:hypothetical protein